MLLRREDARARLWCHEPKDLSLTLKLHGTQGVRRTLDDVARNISQLESRNLSKMLAPPPSINLPSLKAHSFDNEDTSGAVRKGRFSFCIIHEFDFLKLNSVKKACFEIS